jgi:uncharacterized protein (TIGR02145 family)
METQKKISLLSIVVMFGFIVQSQTPPNVSNKTDFKKIKIGDQIWMAENLNLERFSNGDLIPEAKTEEEWNLARLNNKPAWCYYRNNKNNQTNGKLYNWHAVNDPRGLAPKGWHIPKKWEWEKLFDAVGGDTIAGYKLSKKLPYAMPFKANMPFIKKIINESKFGAEPAGERDFVGTFNNNGEEILFWTNNDDHDNNFNKTKAFFILLNCSVGHSSIRSAYKSAGYSVRCLKN